MSTSQNPYSVGVRAPVRAAGYRARAAAWTPPGGMTDHSGAALPAEAEFFAAPPADIGPVQSAYTTLRIGKDPMSPAMRTILATVVAVAAAGIPYFIIIASQGSHDAAVTTAAITAFVAGLCVAFFTRFNHRCTFVGTLGMARYRIKGARENCPRADQLRFAEAAELRASQTRTYHNGIYTGTVYAFIWTDANGRRVYKLNGSHRGGKSGRPKVGDAFYYAQAGEIAWSAYLLDLAQQQLSQAGFIQFNIDKGRFVRVGPGFLEFKLNQDIARINKDEIKKCTLGNGQFHIVHNDAKWFSSAGKFSFSYAKMANARVFLLALDKLVGLRFN